MMLLCVLQEVREVHFLKVEGYPLKVYKPDDTEIRMIESFPRTKIMVFHDPKSYDSYISIPLLNKIFKYTEKTFELVDVRVVKDKKDANGMTQEYAVYDFPTVILEFNGEQCRINPNENRSWEEDIIPCLQKLHNVSDTELKSRIEKDL